MHHLFVETTCGLRLPNVTKNWHIFLESSKFLFLNSKAPLKNFHPHAKTVQESAENVLVWILIENTHADKSGKL